MSARRPGGWNRTLGGLLADFVEVRKIVTIHLGCTLRYVQRLPQNTLPPYHAYSVDLISSHLVSPVENTNKNSAILK